jgi:hypothetical protein
MTVDDFVEAVNSASGGKISASYDDTTGEFTYLINDTNFDDLAISSDGTDATNIGAGVATATVSRRLQRLGDGPTSLPARCPPASTDISVSTAAHHDGLRSTPRSPPQQSLAHGFAVAALDIRGLQRRSRT